ncbi:tRNA (N6-isopentenyl adenosine(37)-C2)-methylthiotransferase MiaB [Aureliella helgolandensis]|uniref:tRNA-2-methylthio-N(6)-dimethylallyladenosine synthase n=1 Tax=Aureliella helgolandensis TaxID=2527968 RepID=A0A518G669_9BACT|nr:tRNA (N6-isopentenyl adenosine(37)-C2)-methylthiotransferase MiaB [Aureliella helgolandensis]QDV24086.1 tRNA-2-methylthio-N(6)-dimethylallyladenosine synthase [Aureliella helgolandensis]
MTHTKTLYIETVGCQMNVLDSEMVVASLKRQGYELATSIEQADTILFNTCSVREHAEEKVYNNLAHLKKMKLAHPEKTLGVMGCMAQKDQQAVFDRAPYVDLVVGPGQLHRIPDLLTKIRDGEGPQMAVSLGRRDGSQADIRRSHETFDPLRDPAMRPTPFQAYLRIQIGCDKFCTYCIVPMTRGPEQGRDPQLIVAEAQELARQGCKEITFIGQTVNSYKYAEGEKTTRLADLLEMVHEIEGIERLKFVTNYPKDMTRELLQTVHDLPKCSTYLHVPAQSGSDEVLKRMKRGYTTSDYFDMMDRINEILPDASISSDFIVGFCGETEEDFQKTVQLVERCRFKNSFIFKYSERPGTRGAELFEDDIPEEVKSRRNVELLAVQDAISLEDNMQFLGKRMTVLVEGPSKVSIKKGESGPIRQMMGRTNCDRIVVWEGNERQTGNMLPVLIHDTGAFTLFGSVETAEIKPDVIEMPSFIRS